MQWGLGQLVPFVRTVLLGELLDLLIALIEGYCIGGGLATALAADVRMASPDSKFGIPAAKLGLGYEYEGLAKLARLVGPSRARDIMFSARFMEAEEAQGMGLINFIEPREDIETACVAYAQRIAGNAPLTVAAAKAAFINGPFRCLACPPRNFRSAPVSIAA